MIDLKALRENPEHFAAGARDKGITVDIDAVLTLDAARREAVARRESARAEQKTISREIGPHIGKLKGQLKSASGSELQRIESEIATLEAKPASLKQSVQEAEAELSRIEPELREALLHIPLPPDPDVPRGASAAENVELREWQATDFDAP